MARKNVYQNYGVLIILFRLLANGKVIWMKWHRTSLIPLECPWVSCRAAAGRSVQQVWISFNQYKHLSAQYGNKSQLCCVKIHEVICLGFQTDSLLLSDVYNLKQICWVEQAMGHEGTLVSSVSETTGISLFKQLLIFRKRLEEKP